jgi:thiamine biosynthesis protein ThiS
MIRLNDKRFPWHAGMTIADLLARRDDREQYAVIKINGSYVAKPNFDTYQIPDNAEIYLIPMIAGG